MKNNFAIIPYLYGIVICLLGLGSGCTAEDEQMEPATVRTVQVQLEVRTSAVTESRTASRVPSDDTFLKTLRIYAFDETGKRVGHFYSKDLPAAPSNTLRMDLRIPENPASHTHQLTFYAVGNGEAMSTPGAEKPLTAQTTKSELDAYTFTQVKTPYSTLGLPMYAQSTQSVDLSKATLPNPEVAGHEGHLLLPEKVTLQLQRPFGRMGLFVAKAHGTTATLTIKGAKMLKEGTRLANYLMPQTVQKLQQIQSMGTDIAFIPNGPLQGVTVDQTFPHANPTPEERKNTELYQDLLQTYGAFYPFENPYGSTDWARPGDPNRGAAVQLDYSFGGDLRTAVVYLPPIERNKYYAVCCLINNTGRITVTYVVADWDDVRFELNFEYPTYSNPIKRWDGPQDDYTQPTVYYHPDADSEVGTFSFAFSITGPFGQTWQPTLLDASASDYELKVFQKTADGKEQEMSPPYLASPDPYRIRIKALDVNKENNTVRFAIAYTPIWDKDGTSLLMINGASGKTYWTESENPVEVKFTQIAPPQTNP